MPDAPRALLATGALFGAAGFGVVRLLLPGQLRRYELLWIIPTGACAAGVLLTVLGFAAVPYHVSLVALILAGLALDAFAVRTRGWPAFPAAQLAWPCSRRSWC